jgi:hypothetical protein
MIRLAVNLAMLMSVCMAVGFMIALTGWPV